MDVISKIEKCIRESFNIGPFPQSLLKADVSEHLHSGVIETKKYFEGKRWDEVDLSNASKNDPDIWFAPTVMTEEAYIYYFPAFMLNSIKDSVKKSMLVDCFIESYLNIDNVYQEKILDFYLNMPAQQSRCVAAFVDYFATHENKNLARRALESFWSSYI